MSAARAEAQSIIDSNPVVVFSKSYCPYCQQTKSLLNSFFEDSAVPHYKVIELDVQGDVSDGSAVQSALKEMTHQGTVPNIFIGRKHIGGNSDLQNIPKGKLKSLLQDAGAF